MISKLECSSAAFLNRLRILWPCSNLPFVLYHVMDPVNRNRPRYIIPNTKLEFWKHSRSNSQIALNGIWFQNFWKKWIKLCLHGKREYQAIRNFQRNFNQEKYTKHKRKYIKNLITIHKTLIKRVVQKSVTIWKSIKIIPVPKKVTVGQRSDLELFLVQKLENRF